ncbi:MAG: XRE family transcriptional regulator [Bacteroidetes bacterium]|nr:MAG: XRE family transcriptional regulator [Bacteroidota bacterium]
MHPSGRNKRRKEIGLIQCVAKNIAKFRLKKKLSQEELRNKTGLEVARCESGKYDMTLTTIGILAKHLEIESFLLLKK